MCPKIIIRKHLEHITIHTFLKEYAGNFVNLNHIRAAGRRDSERQEAETWRSLHQFSRNALELSMKRRRAQPVFDGTDGDMESGMNSLL